MRGTFNRIIALIILECFIFTSSPALVYAQPVKKSLTEQQTEPAGYKQTVFPGEAARLEYSGVVLEIPAGAVSEPVEITIEPLAGVPPLPGSFANVTTGGAGFRFGPHGIKFNKNISVALPFSPGAAQSEAALSNLFTYFYNEDSRHWERLRRLSIDRDNFRVISATNHFTDMVNTTLQLPELPQGVDFNLNSIKELKAADPTEGIPGLKGLEGNNSGTATFQIPLKIPPGRGGATPGLVIGYNSDSPSGWLGRGFDIPLPRISVDTRFGLPEYEETDTFLMSGEELVPFQQTPGENLYRLRREGSFQRIRHISGEGVTTGQASGINYWEVTAKDGSLSYYGQADGWLGPDPGDRSKVYVWYLTRTVDPSGNTVDYTYQYNTPDQNTYLREIVYSGHTSGTAGKYKVSFIPEDRPDRRIDSRGRFPSRMGERLGRVEIRFEENLVRAYNFNYSENLYGQSQLDSYSEEDRGGNLFYTYTFDYYQLPEHREGSTLQGYDAFTEEKRWGAGDHSKGLDEKITVSLGGNLSAGIQAYAPYWGGRKSIAHLTVNGGVNFGWNFSKSTLMDVNGDGLPDLVWKDGPALYSYLNGYNPATGEGKFNLFDPYRITGVDNLLNKGSQTGFSLGVSAGALISSVSVNKQYNWTESKSAFSDVDGDGLVDIVDTGAAVWKRNNGEGSFLDTPWTMNEENNGSGGEAPGLDPAQQEEFNRTYYRQEPLRRWNVYTPGTVRIENNISLLDGYNVSSDGVDASIYLNDERRTTHLDRDRVSAVDHFTRTVTAGDQIFFHLSTGEDERGDALDWDTTIRYEDIALFDDMTTAAVLSPPASSSGTLPGGDSRLAPIYRESGNTFTLRGDWQSLCTPGVYDALASGGYFIPRRIPLSSFKKIYDAVPAENGQTVRASLLSGYDYIPEKQEFVRRNNQADGVVRQYAPGVWTEGEKRELMFYTWLDGRKIYPAFEGTAATYTQARTSSPASRIFDPGDAFIIGDYVRDKGYLLDRVYRENDKSLPLYSLWLREEPGGEWSLYREEAESEIKAPGVASVNESGASLTTGGLTGVYSFTGKAHLIKQVPADLYNEVTASAFMTGESFSLTGIETIPETAYSQVYSGLEESDRPLMDSAFILNEEEGNYHLAEGITPGDFLTLSKWFDSTFSVEDSLFNTLPGEEVKRIILLSQEEYDRFTGFFPGDVSPWFSVFTEPGAEGDQLWYTWNRETVGPETAAGLYEYRRDRELFPYYTKSGATYTLREDIPAPETWQKDVETLWQNAGYHLWNNLTFSLTFQSGDRLPVEPGILPPGASEKDVTPVAWPSSGAKRNDQAPGSGGTTGQATGIINLLTLDGAGDSVIVKQYIPVFNSQEDFSTQDLVIYPEEIFPKGENTEENLPELNITFDDFSGGNGGWFYDQWCGYHPFNKELIGTYPQQGGDSEVMIPPYTLNTVTNFDPGTGGLRIEETGAEPGIPVPLDAWIGEISSYSEPVLDDEGNNTNKEYAFTAFTWGNRMYPGRKGGDAYHRVPRGNGPLSGGTLSAITKSKSLTFDVSGGASIEGFGGNFSRNSGRSWQYAGLMDLNGDRYPDLLTLPQDGGTGGTLTTGTKGGFSDVRETSFPFSHLSEYENLIFGFGGSVNGGGPGINFGMNSKARAYFSVVQNPDDSGGGLGQIGGGVNGTLGQSVQTAGFVDINGDGLPDQVSRSETGAYSVHLNTGADSWTPFTWPGGMNEDLSHGLIYTSGLGRIASRSEGLAYTNTGSFGGSVSLGIGPATVSGGFTGNQDKTAFRLEDVNGDGLPDQVGKDKAEDFFRVRFNLGDSFSENTVKLYRPDWGIDIDNVLSEAVNHDLGIISGQMDGLSLPGVPLRIPGFEGFPTSGNRFSEAVNPLAVDDLLDYSSGVSFNLGASMTLSWDWWLLALTLTPGVNGSYATTSTSLQFRDLNGDGLPDHVLKLPGEEFVRVKENAMGQVGLLKKVTLPAGGTISLKYSREGNTTDLPGSRYTLSSVSHYDGMEGRGPGESVHTYETSYSYNGGYYDRQERQFYGFREVTAAFGDGSYKVTGYHNRDYSRRGLAEAERFYGPGGRLYTETLYDYAPRTYYGLEGKKSTFQGLSGITSRYYGQGTDNYTESVQVFDYDSFGNINFLEDRGSTFSGEDDYTLTVSYADLPGYRHSYPAEMIVYDGDDNILRRRWGSYYDNGTQKEIRHYLTESRYSAYTFTYDLYGNPRSVTGPGGLTREYFYDTTVNQYPAQIDVYNTADKNNRYTSFMEWDYARGLNTARVDQNGNREKRDYDSHGRLTDLISPYDTLSTPAVHFDYHTTPGAFPWFTVTGNKLRFDPADTQVMKTHVYADGLGRVLLTAKEGETGYGTNRRKGWNCSGAAIFDAKGRTVATGQPVFREGPEFPDLPELVRPVRMTYDFLDRITEKILPDGSSLTSAYLVEDHNSLTRATDPQGNITEEVRGLRDEIKAIRKKDTTGTILTSTSYTYDPLSQLLEARDHRDNPVSFTYDLAGNRRTVESPDGGLIEYFYDDGGNLIRKNDPNLRARGQAITYKYDDFNRLVLVDYPRMKDTQYSYGDPGEENNRAGRLIRRVDESGEIRFSYGLLGENSGVTQNLHRIAPLSEDKTASFTYKYDYLGRMEEILYPDGEILTYGYDTGGQVQSITGERNGLTTAYVREVGYNEQGQRIYSLLGNGTETVYTYNPERRWLDNIKTENSYSRVYQDITYTFDSVGNVRGYTNAADRYTTIQSYDYDNLYQLTGASGSYEAKPYGMTDFRSQYRQDFGYDSIGNLLSKNSEVRNSPAISRGQGLTYSLDYEYYPEKPHQAERIGNHWYRYDSNGNVIEDREGGHSPAGTMPDNLELQQEETPEGDLFILNYGFGLVRENNISNGDSPFMRRFTWDEENRLKQSTDAMRTVAYLYDADGNRTAKYTTRGESLYFNSMWSMTEDWPNFRQSKHIYLGTSRIATKMKIEDDNSTGYERVNTYYYHSDHLGSAQLITDFEGQPYEHMEYTPYGELWIEEQSDSFDKIPFAYTSKELDRENNLYYYGARYFDPKISRWMGVDPAGERLVDPRADDFSLVESTNWYSYCSHSPLNFIDPDGRDDEPLPFWNSTARLMGMTAHRYIETALLMQYPTGEMEKKVPEDCFIGFGKVDFALPMSSNGKKYEFYEIKPITQQTKRAGQAQLDDYIEKALADNIAAIKGISILSGMQGMRISNIPFSVPVGRGQIGHYLGDIRVITFPGDASKQGLIYYEIQNLRPNTELYIEQAKATVIVGGIAIGMILAPEIVVAGGGALIPQLVH